MSQPAVQTRRYFQTTRLPRPFAHPIGCYTVADICRLLKFSRRTFYALKEQGQLPLIELLPRLGRVIRYDPGPIDRYLTGGR